MYICVYLYYIYCDYIYIYTYKRRWILRDYNISDIYIYICMHIQKYKEENKLLCYTVVHVLYYCIVFCMESAYTTTFLNVGLL